MAESLADLIIEAGPYEPGEVGVWINTDSFTTGVRSETVNVLRDELIELRALVTYALHLRIHGEMAPGGNETWAEFDRRAEMLLRGAGRG